MRRLLSIFFSAPGRNKWIVLACLWPAGLAQSVGIASILPLLDAAVGTVEPDNVVNAVAIGALESVGLSPSFLVLSVVIFLGFAIKASLVMLAMTYVGYAVAQVATDLRLRLIDSLLKVRWSYFVRQPLGSIANAVSLDANRSANAYSMVALVLSYSIQSFFYVVVALVVSWKVSLVAISFAAVTALVLTTFVRMAKRAGEKQTVRTRELLAHLTDALLGIKPLKAMNRHGRFAELFTRQTVSVNKALRKQVIAKEGLKNLQEPLIALCFLLVFSISTLFLGTPIEELIVVAISIYAMITSVIKVQKQLQMAVIDESAYYAVHDMIEEAAAEAEPRHAGKPPTLLRSCRFENVSFAYGERPVLIDVSIDIPAGRLTVITGGSGAGKTTLVDLLIGLHEPNRGRVLIDGDPLKDLDIEKWRAMVGYVPQDLVLFHDTVANNVALGDPRFSTEDVRVALKAADAERFVDALPDGLDHVVGERGLRTSGGQRQRIALARALIHKPTLLILDEVTSALDPATETEICRNVKSLLREGDRRLTVLAITHRSAWLDEADVVYHLGDDGKVVPAVRDASAVGAAIV